MSLAKAGLVLKKTDVPSYFDSDLSACIDLWEEWKRYKQLPSVGGTWDQLNLWREIVDCVDSAVKEVKSWQQEK